MNENIEQSLELGIGIMMCLISIKLFFTFQELVSANYQLLFQKIGG